MADDPVAAQYAAIVAKDLDAARRAVAPDWINRESESEPPAARQGGPIGLAVTGAWLRFAFSDIAFDELERVAAGNVIMSRVLFSGRQTGPLVLFENDRPAVVFPPTGRRFRVEQIHRHEVRDGSVAGHLARRDDLGMLQQLGHLPPNPRSIVRMLWWRLSGRARRAGADAIAIGEIAASEMTAFMAARGDEHALGSSGGSGQDRR
jgi:predicted ester cyclase